MPMRRICGERLSVALLLIVLSVLPGNAQVNPASWRGFVRSSSGQAVPDARVMLNLAGRTLTAVTSSEGLFEFHDLAPGRCLVKVEWSGGVSTVQPQVEIIAGSRRNG
jgi:hypothetical protein